MKNSIPRHISPNSSDFKTRKIFTFGISAQKPIVNYLWNPGLKGIWPWYITYSDYKENARQDLEIIGLTAVHQRSDRASTDGLCRSRPEPVATPTPFLLPLLRSRSCRRVWNHKARRAGICCSGTERAGFSDCVVSDTLPVCEAGHRDGEMAPKGPTQRSHCHRSAVWFHFCETASLCDFVLTDGRVLLRMRKKWPRWQADMLMGLAPSAVLIHFCGSRFVYNPRWELHNPFRAPRPVREI